MPIISEQKQQRLQHANAIAAAMARHGRRFFLNATNGRVGAFEFDDRGYLRWRDEQSHRAILVAKGGPWRGFNHGGTLRRIVESLADYIRVATPVPNHFGPWPEWTNGGDLWGYGDAARAVRRDIADNPALSDAARAAIAADIRPAPPESAVVAFPTACPECAGSGHIKDCPECAGSGSVEGVGGCDVACVGCGGSGQRPSFDPADAQRHACGYCCDRPSSRQTSQPEAAA